MKRTVIAALILALPLLTAACNTVGGFGEDVQKGGQDIQGTANRNK